jgi:serine protease Do
MNGELTERIRRSTVLVEIEGGGRAGSGSGVIVGPRATTIVTNAHVARLPLARVHLWDGRVVEARVGKKHARRDLAELHIDVPGLPALPLGDSSLLRPGHLVVAVGNPLGFEGAASSGVVRSVGPVSGLGTQPWVQASVRLAPGNSGGPLADAQGQLVGINTMVLGHPGGLGLAIPSRAVNDFLTRPAPPRLGVSVRGVRVKAGGRGIGLLLLEVEPGAAAERASLRAGDVLVGAEGRAFSTPDELPDVIENGGAANGGQVRLQFLRGSQSHTREVTVRL